MAHIKRVEFLGDTLWALNVRKGSYSYLVFQGFGIVHVRDGSKTCNYCPDTYRLLSYKGHDSVSVRQATEKLLEQAIPL